MHKSKESSPETPESSKESPRSHHTKKTLLSPITEKKRDINSNENEEKSQETEKNWKKVKKASREDSSKKSHKTEHEKRNTSEDHTKNQTNTLTIDVNNYDNSAEESGSKNQAKKEKNQKKRTNVGKKTLIGGKTKVERTHSTNSSPPKGKPSKNHAPVVEIDEALWFVKKTDGWEKYSSNVNVRIEKAYHKGDVNCSLDNIFTENDSYTFNFVENTQTNNQNNQKLSIRREAPDSIIDPPSPGYIPPPPPEKDTYDKPPTIIQKLGNFGNFNFVYKSKPSKVFATTTTTTTTTSSSIIKDLTTKKPTLVQSQKGWPMKKSKESKELKNSKELEKVEESKERVETKETKDPKETKVVKVEKQTENSPSEDSSSPLPKAKADLGRFDFSKMPLPPKRNEGGDKKEIFEQLHNFFLSSRGGTEKEKDDKNEKVPEVTKEQMNAILKENVEDLENMLDRSGATPVSNYIISTYYSGLPLFKGNNALQNHTIHAMRVIFHKAPALPPSVRKPMFQRLAEAYSACQMEQGRVIDSIYGAITGRDKTFKEQILMFVDVQKEDVLNQIVNRYNPDAWKTSDDNPKGQIPHIQSSYTIAMGDKLGLRGVKAAKMDKDSFNVDPRNVAILTKCFKRLFSVQDVINAFIADVNQQEEGVDRIVDCNSLTKWAGDPQVNNGFPGHGIFYDEDSPGDWDKELGVPKEENKYKPFLNHQVALNLFVHVFLKK